MSDLDAMAADISSGISAARTSILFATRVHRGGNVYEGELVDGARCGWGTYTWANGQRFEGQWEGGQLHGIGLLRRACGSQWLCRFNRGVPHGRLRITWPSGDTLEASYADHFLCGFGRKVTADGTVFEGNFADGVRNGYGVERRTSGYVFEGNYVNDAPHGQGKKRFANGDVYEGAFVAGKPEGRGRITYRCGDMHDGSYRLGLRDGFGFYRWANGQSHTGYWLLGKREGRGTLVDAITGCVTQGTWVRDRPNGTFISTLNGETVAERYRDGARVSRSRTEFVPPHRLMTAEPAATDPEKELLRAAVASMGEFIADARNGRRGATATCVVCQDEWARYVNSACGHLALCRTCSDRLDKCPVCRVPITFLVLTYQV